MNENQTIKSIRPTRKQKQLLDYVANFIAENGYSPSYREIQEGLGYKSLATVAIHVKNLISGGHLTRTGHYARSLDLVESSEPTKITSNQISPNQEKWLVEKVEHVFGETERGNDLRDAKLDQLSVLIAALRILGLDGAAQSFVPRLAKLKQKQPY